MRDLPTKFGIGLPTKFGIERIFRQFEIQYFWIIHKFDI